MKEVKIYIDTSFTGPGTRKGGYAAAIVCMTAKGPATIGIVGEEEETTYYRCALQAVVAALRRLKAPCKAEIYTDCRFIVNMYERGYVEKWRGDGWKRSSGEPVANKELWEDLLQEIGRIGGADKIAFTFSKFNDGRVLTRKLMREQNIIPRALKN